MNNLTDKQVFSLMLNLDSNIWTTGKTVLDIKERYQTTWGTIACLPGISWCIIDFKFIEESDENNTFNIVLENYIPLNKALFTIGVRNFTYHCRILKMLKKGRLHPMAILEGVPLDIAYWR